MTDLPRVFYTIDGIEFSDIDQVNNFILDIKSSNKYVNTIYSITYILHFSIKFEIDKQFVYSRFTIELSDDTDKLMLYDFTNLIFSNMDSINKFIKYFTDKSFKVQNKENITIIPSKFKSFEYLINLINHIVFTPADTIDLIEYEKKIRVLFEVFKNKDLAKKSSTVTCRKLIISYYSRILRGNTYEELTITTPLLSLYTMSSDVFTFDSDAFTFDSQINEYLIRLFMPTSFDKYNINNHINRQKKLILEKL
jgi:hypothetical protein